MPIKKGGLSSARYRSVIVSTYLDFSVIVDEDRGF